MTTDFLEEIVNFQRKIDIIIIDYRQGIELHLVFLKQFDAPHYLFKRAPSSFVFSVYIVAMLRTVDRNADKEIIIFEELTPIVVKQRSIGLQAVVDYFVELGKSVVVENLHTVIIDSTFAAWIVD